MAPTVSENTKLKSFTAFYETLWHLIVLVKTLQDCLSHLMMVELGNGGSHHSTSPRHHCQLFRWFEKRFLSQKRWCILIGLSQSEAKLPCDQSRGRNCFKERITEDKNASCSLITYIWQVEH